MRLKVTRLWRASKRELPIQFGLEQLTSYGGLELVRRYFHLIGLNARIRCALGKHAGGDYGCTHLVLLVIGLLVVGARRLQHLRYLTNDSWFARFCGLSRIPSNRTVVNWLKQFTQTSLRGLMCRNRELLYEQIQKLALRRLTIDLDGTVIRTEGRVGDARLQPSSPQGSQLLPAAGPSGSDRADPAAQEPPGQRSRLQGRGALRARTDRRDSHTPGVRADAGIPHGRGLFPATSAQAAQPPGVLLCGQSTLVSVDRGESPDRRPSAVDGGHWRYRWLRDPA